jgi:hypothetical protein
MNRREFLQDESIAGFVSWLAKSLGDLSVNLDIKDTKFVPGGLRTKCSGFDEVLTNYKWCPSKEDQATCDWVGTKRKLENLTRALRDAGKNPGDGEVRLLDACNRIIQWGGSPGLGNGAGKFLKRLQAEGRLNAYLKYCAAKFFLQDADSDDFVGVEDMYSMLTKIHALYATDGLPIYDSRVAVAIAALIELARRDRPKPWADVPKVLCFPAVPSRMGKGRRVRDLFDDAHNPGDLRWQKDRVQLAARWSSAKVRLGWIMQAVLECSDKLFESEGNAPSRMRAFEASLFMIGYDVKCLK